MVYQQKKSKVTHINYVKLYSGAIHKILYIEVRYTAGFILLMT